MPDSFLFSVTLNMNTYTSFVDAMSKQLNKSTPVGIGVVYAGTVAFYWAMSIVSSVALG
jgi:hypothetical protein